MLGFVSKLTRLLKYQRKIKLVRLFRPRKSWNEVTLLGHSLGYRITRAPPTYVDVAWMRKSTIYVDKNYYRGKTGHGLKMNREENANQLLVVHHNHSEMLLKWSALISSSTGCATHSTFVGYVESNSRVGSRS